MFRRALLSVLLGLGGLAETATAAPDPDAETILLRSACVEPPATDPLPNCIETLAELDAYIANIGRFSNDANPLLVDIGPGVFVGNLTCLGAGNFALRGTGQGPTILRQDPAGTTFVGDALLGVASCENISVQNLRLEGEVGVAWIGGGSSTWDNVEIFVTGDDAYGWKTLPGACFLPPRHELRSVRIMATTEGDGTPAGEATGIGLSAACGSFDLQGSEVTAAGGATAAGPTLQAGVVVSGPASVDALTTVVRSISKDASAATFGVPNDVSGLVGVLVGYEPIANSAVGGGTFDGHAANVVVSAMGSQVNPDVTGVRVLAPAGSPGSARTHSLSFTLVPGASSTAHRIRAQPGAILQAPFLWPPDHPFATRSSNGADLIARTECSADGDCGVPDETAAHLFIYNESCATSGEPWFNVVTRDCEGE